MTELTERLDAIQARVDAATPGPWEPMKSGLLGTRVVHVDGEWEGLIPDGFVTMVTPALKKPNDAEFIAAAHSDVPFLLDLARKQAAAIEAVEKLANEKYRLWAAICGNTCSKEFLGVDHDAIADEIASAIHDVIRAALEAKP